jgi:AcrR family transcriptional regulator
MLDNPYSANECPTASSYSSLVSQALQHSSPSVRLSPTKQRRRQALLNAAFELANSHSVHELNIQTIVKQAKTTRTTAYHYFHNSDELVSELLLQWFGHCLEAAAKQLDTLNNLADFGHNKATDNNVNKQLSNNSDQNITTLLAEMYRHPKMIALLLHGLSTCSQYQATKQYHQSLALFLMINNQPEQAKLLFHGALVALASGGDMATIIDTIDRQPFSTPPASSQSNNSVPVH